MHLDNYLTKKHATQQTSHKTTTKKKKKRWQQTLCGEEETAVLKAWNDQRMAFNIVIKEVGTSGVICKVPDFKCCLEAKIKKNPALVA